MRNILELVRARQLGPSGEGRRIRQSAGLTQAELAEAVGVNGATLCRWETGKTVPTQRHVAMWADTVARVVGALEQVANERGGE